MSTEKPYPASAPPSEDAWLQPRDVEVSWLGVIDRLLPSRRSDASGMREAVSPLTVAGAAPASHRLPCRIAPTKLARGLVERYRCPTICPRRCHGPIRRSGRLDAAAHAGDPGIA